MRAAIRFKKLRLWLVYPAFIVYPFVARMADVSFGLGMALMAAGLLIRFWASGYIKKSRVLATDGPYALTRNPLYVGNFLLGLGVVVASSHPGLILYYIATFVILYLGTMGEEEKVLEEKFGSAYAAYKAAVPAFFPSLSSYKKSEKKGFDIRQSFKNGEFIRIAGFILLMLTLNLWRACAIRKESWLDQGFFIALFVVFFALLWLNIAVRRHSERRLRRDAAPH